MNAPGLAHQRHRLAFRLASVVLSACVVTGIARAQYFDRPEYRPSEARYLYAGVMQRDFVPLGSNPVNDSLAIRFKRIMPFLGFHQGMVDVVFGYTTYSLRGFSRSSIFFGTTVATEVPISFSRSNALLLPVMISADFTKAEAPGSERDNFNVGSVGIGAGLKYRFMAGGIEFTLQAAEVASFSFEGLSTQTGFSAVTLADAALHLKDISILEGIVIAYRFRLQTWSMSDDRFNYRSVSHGPSIGVMF